MSRKTPLVLLCSPLSRPVMKFLAPALSLLALRSAEAYLVAPLGTPAPGAPEDCSAWVQDAYGLTCAIIEEFYGMTEAQFEEWNPTAAELGDCTLIQGLYYCVQVNYSTLTTVTFTTSIPGASSTTATTTPTSVAGSTTTGTATKTLQIATPSPTQTGMVGNCNNFYLVKSGDTCSEIAVNEDIALGDFYTWNAAVGSTCANLLSGYFVCVGVVATGTTTKAPTSTTLTTVTKTTGIVTPTPIQTGTVSDCDDFYLVRSGDTCDTVAAAEGISVSDLYAWNPAVGVNTCKTLLAGYYICVGVKGSSTTSTAAPTTTAPLGNGITTPTPYQTGMVSDCDDFYLVQSGDICDTIAAEEGISVADFYTWNPDVGVNTCKSLLAEYYVCTGIELCTTNTFGLVVPQPSGAVCGVSAVSNGGTTLLSYSSGPAISNLLNCKNACLDTVGCTNLYFAEGEYCNLHSGAETHVASSNSVYTFYDSTCFICPSKCLSAPSPPAHAICNVKALSNGGTTIISYSSGTPIQSMNNCAATCLATTGCSNLYYEPGTYCNLHAGTETHQLSSTSPYYFYDASCFDCGSPSCTTNSQGLAVPQPSGAICNVAAYSNGGTTLVSYSSGESITSLKACGEECLATLACTNLYYEARKYCNLHSGAETHNPDASSPYAFYDVSCFEC
ncbi:carbohydrate-binding module family 50 protein [Xylaria arbuscula]|nr:carbohydrate-binding module family 50 protein [Xylaria arbuscula]